MSFARRTQRRQCARYGDRRRALPPRQCFECNPVRVAFGVSDLHGVNQPQMGIEPAIGVRGIGDIDQKAQARQCLRVPALRRGEPGGVAEHKVDGPVCRCGHNAFGR